MSGLACLRIWNEVWRSGMNEYRRHTEFILSWRVFRVAIGVDFVTTGSKVRRAEKTGSRRQERGGEVDSGWAGETELASRRLCRIREIK